MVIITDASGNIQAPTIPENVYQGSNEANSITFLSPLPQSSECVIAFRLPNGVLTEPTRMSPYTSVPSEYNLNAWVCSLDETITALYGQVSFQIKVYNSSGKIVAGCQGSFPVLRGVPPILPAEPTTSIYEQILEALSGVNSDLENGWLVSKGTLPYDATFSYPLGASIFDKTTNAIYTSLADNNLGNALTDTTKWGVTHIQSLSQAEIQTMINNSVGLHNLSQTAHQDIRSNITNSISTHNNSITAHSYIQNRITEINNKIPAEASSVNKLADKAFVTNLIIQVDNKVTAINEKIPAQASAENQLADKDFVNSSIATNTANFIGTFTSVELLESVGYLVIYSILKENSVIAKGSVVNGTTYNHNTTLHSDLNR